MAGLGERLRRVRQDKGLNQKDFGGLGGVGLTTQQQYENGKTPPNAEYFTGFVNMASTYPGC